MRIKPTLLGIAALSLAVLPIAAQEAETTTLTGSYMSRFQDDDRALEAVFTPTGENEYSVVFYFNFDGRDHTYEGTAEGSLSEGALQGEVKNESRARTFTFRGEFKDGNFHGEHGEIRRGRERDTGTLTLGP